MYTLVDFKSKKTVSASNFVFTGEDSPWEVMMDLEQIRARMNISYFKKTPPYHSKYLPLMPVRDCANFISLEEGATPLIKSRHLGAQLGIDVYFKLEGKNPTGSFKDRGSALELSVARELGVKGMTVASTGNMAASCACYAAFANIPCFIFVPEGTPPSKLSQAIAYGGRIVQVKGGYNDAARLAKQVAEELNFYLAGDYAYRVEGQKTAAFELIDQLYFNVPDAVFVPIGCGTNITAYYKGFQEYQKLGLIEGIPALVGVQAEGAASVVQSFHRHSRDVEALSKVDTICSAIGVSYPLDGVKALDAIYASQGSALAVSDKDALEAQYMLAKKEGLFIETSSATSVAALIKFANSSAFRYRSVVCVLSGDGLKDPTSILKVAIKPPTIKPEVDEFRALYEESFFEGKTVAFVDREQKMFDTPPTRAELQSRIQQYFGQQLSDTYLAQIEQKIMAFLAKGKPVIFSDLQDILQHTLESTGRRETKVFSVKDFEVTTGRDRKPVANVSVTVNSTTFTATSDGVGPVDALINALRKAVPDEVAFSLSDYKVDIRNRGTDAVVFVELTLHRNSQSSQGTGASPDIIQASIEAFENAYNGLSL